jgi:transcriptional regulator with XRE-family HTH domain
MENKARMLLAGRVRQLRKERGWSQEDLANASGLHRTYIGGIERGERNCGVDAIEKLASAFGISIDGLFGSASAKADEMVLVEEYKD